MALLPSSDSERERHPVTILRVHGVGGWSSTETLLTSDAVQVAGDGLSGFYRRAGRIRAGDAGDGGTGSAEDADQEPVLEAYSWGLFSSKALAQAFWLLLIPFTLVNLAYWMMPGDRKPPSTRSGARAGLVLPHRRLGSILRAVGLVLTLEFFMAVAGVTVGVVGEQCGNQHCHSTTISLAWLPPEFSWIRHPGLPKVQEHRLVMTMLLAVLVLFSQWWLCWLTRRRYEQWPPRHHTNPAWDAPDGGTALAGEGFWLGDERVLRLGLLHSSAVLAMLAWIADACARTHQSRSVEVVAIAAVVVCIVLASLDSLVGPTVFRPVEGGGHNPIRYGLWLLVAGCGGLLAWSSDRLWTAPKGAVGTPPFMPGWTDAFFVGAIAQGALLLLVLLGLAYARFAGADDAVPRQQGWTPFVQGIAPAGVAALGVGLAGVATAGAITVAELVYVTTPKVDGKQPNTQRLLPDVFRYLDSGATVFLVVIAVVLLALCLGVLFVEGKELWGNSLVQVPAPDDAPAASKAWWSAVLLALVSKIRGRQTTKVLYNRRRLSIWSAYLVGKLPEPLLATLMGFAPLALVVAAVLAWKTDLPSRIGDGDHAGIASAVLGTVTFAAIALLAAERDANKRRVVGILWDVATFWPRASHPFAPPCYAERAVPELVHRLRWLVGEKDTNQNEVVLLGYSQGAPIVAAALFQLPTEIRKHIWLLTMGNPIRRLYGRGYPVLFNKQALEGLGVQQWRNVWRPTDFVGGYMMAEGSVDKKGQSMAGAAGCIDVRILDPVSFGPIDGDTAFPPANEHFDFFSDHQVAVQLHTLVSAASAPGRPAAVVAAPAPTVDGIWFYAGIVRRDPRDRRAESDRRSRPPAQ